MDLDWAIHEPYNCNRMINIMVIQTPTFCSTFYFSEVMLNTDYCKNFFYDLELSLSLAKIQKNVVSSYFGGGE